MLADSVELRVQLRVPKFFLNGGGPAFACRGGKDLMFLYFSICTPLAALIFCDSNC